MDRSQIRSGQAPLTLAGMNLFEVLAGTQERLMQAGDRDAFELANRLGDNADSLEYIATSNLLDTGRSGK